MLNLATFPERTDNVDIGAERNTLACLVKTSDAWLKLPAGFSTDDFNEPLNKALFTVIDSLYSKGATADIISVYEALPPLYKKELEDLGGGGWGYLQTLQDLPIDASNITYEAEKLVELTTRRRISYAGERIQDLASHKESLPKIREKVELAISEIDRAEGAEAVNIGVNGIDFIDKRMAAPKEVPGLSSGFPQLDKVIQGFQAGRLYVVGARKKTGKSMLLLNWAKHIAVDCGKPVLWISTEHSIDDEFSRALSLTSGVPELLINNGVFSQVDKYHERVEEARAKIASSPFFFVSMPMFNLQKIRHIARKMVRVYGVEAIFFDFIKTPESESTNKEWQELGNFAYGLKALGEMEHVPVISACQVNREGIKNFKVDGDIDSDHFAGSDRIAHAVSVAFVLREPTHDEVSGFGAGRMGDNFRVLKISDNRHGPSGRKFLLDFDGEVINMRENKCL